MRRNVAKQAPQRRDRPELQQTVMARFHLTSVGQASFSFASAGLQLRRL